MSADPSLSPTSLSIIIPVYNEADNIAPLADALRPVLDALGIPAEVVFVNDGSADDTLKHLRAAATADPRLRVVDFRRNVGQTAAMMAGIDHARGSILIPMDGDLQNDPKDIPALLAKLDEGYDVVSGWRQRRQDPFLTRRLPSRMANAMISLISGVRLRDYGCTLKAYRREVLKGFRLYGEMHRFVPIYARWQGARITEIPVNHAPRRAGVSKYGLNRVFKVLLDLLVVKFLTQYETKPIYVFGAAAFVFFIISFIAGSYALYLKFFENISFILTPLPLLFSLGFITGVMCLLLGLLAEVLVRIYFESQNKAPYTVRETINFNPPDTTP